MDLKKTQPSRDTDSPAKAGGCSGETHDAKPAAAEAAAQPERTATTPAPKSGCCCGNR